MPPPLLPRAKADVSGAALHNPKRFKDRKPPQTGALGSPPSWMLPEHVVMWHQFASEIPWLDGSHRSLLEIACGIRARMASGQEVGIQALNLLRQCLGQMGATPADAAKVNVPDAGEVDPDEQFFKSRAN